VASTTNATRKTTRARTASHIDFLGGGAERENEASAKNTALKHREEGEPRRNSDGREDANEAGALVGEDFIPVRNSPNIAAWLKNIWAVFELKNFPDPVNDAFYGFPPRGRASFWESCIGIERHASHPANPSYDSTTRCICRVEQP